MKHPNPRVTNSSAKVLLFSQICKKNIGQLILCKPKEITRLRNLAIGQLNVYVLNESLKQPFRARICANL